MLYASTKKAIPQVLADAGLVAWIGLWLFLCVKARDAVMHFADPAYSAQDTAKGMESSLWSAASSIRDVPLVGSVLSPALGTFGLSVTGLVVAIQQYIDMVKVASIVVAVIVAVIPIGVYLWKWLPWRFAFVREAAAGRKLLPADASAELFALRAIAHAPMRDLVQISVDPLGAWRRGEMETIRRLANLELARDGLKLPTGSSSVTVSPDMDQVESVGQVGFAASVERVDQVEAMGQVESADQAEGLVQVEAEDQTGAVEHLVRPVGVDLPSHRGASGLSGSRLAQLRSKRWSSYREELSSSAAGIRSSEDSQS
ncbi:MAG: hypothetical protein LBV06_09125 [Propionibacteriaceae bacterium]|jgi:hypothetical protein|nr:hypothetical protein [Propionibacteriaceae bacterium]